MTEADNERGDDLRTRDGSGRDRRLITAIACISILAVVGSWIGIQKAERYLLEREASSTAVHWAMFLQEHLTELGEIVRTGLISAGDQQVFDFASQAGGVFRYEVINADGVTTLSSWAGDFRKSNTQHALRVVIDSGKPAVNLLAGTAFNRSVDLVGEASVPVLSREDQVVGVIKVYVDMTARARALRNTGLIALAGLVGLLSVIGVLCGSFVWHNIRDRNRELREILRSRERIATAEKTIRALNRRNEMILNAAGEGIYGLDSAGNTTFVNPAGARMLGRPAEDLIGHKQHALIHHTRPDGTPYPLEQCPIYGALKTGTARQVADEVFWRGDGTSFPVEYTSTPIRDENGEVSGAVVVFRDISERRRAEKELARQAVNLARSNAELEQFAYVASHDLQEPLRKIQAFGDRLKTKSADTLSEETRDYLERMLNAAERMRRLIDDLLTFSRAGTSEQTFGAVDLNQLVREVLNDLEVRIHALGAKVDVGELPTVEADPTQMRQLLQNLISNALKFHRPEAEPIIRINARYCEANEPLMRGLSTNGVACQILVEDNGIGFDEKYADRIFAIFKRLHGRNEYQGTGIGLAICRTIVERHNGRIKATSKPGQGATFIVTLPVQQERDKVAA